MGTVGRAHDAGELGEAGGAVAIPARGDQRDLAGGREMEVECLEQVAEGVRMLHGRA